MDGLPFLPGYRFEDLTKKNYHVSTQFRWKNGYALPKDKSIGIGKAPLDVDSLLFNNQSFGPSVIGYDLLSELTYGKAKDPPIPSFQPRFVEYEGKCLLFTGYTKQIDLQSPIDTYRVRRVRIKYFLVDDTISVEETAFSNAGYTQGCLLKRGPVPKPDGNGRTWHWSDLNIGIDVSLYEVTYRLCSCDAFTKNYLLSQGVTLCPEEHIPNDPYMLDRWQKQKPITTKTIAEVNECKEAEIDKFRQFIQYDGHVLRFYAAWNYDNGEYSRWKYYEFLYFMADDQVEIHYSKQMNSDKSDYNPNTTFLRKTKLPVDWNNLPQNFPVICMEPGSQEYKKYYTWNDLLVGNTIFVVGRRFFLFDCDLFTRNYYKQKWQIVQPEPIKIMDPDKIPPTVYPKIVPPHSGIGDPDDSLQNCLSLVPKPPKTVDFVTYVLNAHKKLRYKLKMVPVYEEDKLRNFIMEFCLGNDNISITELAGKNSGFIRGRYVASSRLRKPNTAIDDNDFYGTKDFEIGSKLYIRGSVFEIVDLDLWTYKFMNQHKFMFTQEAIDGAKSLLERNGLLDPQQKDVLNDNSSSSSDT